MVDSADLVKAFENFTLDAAGSAGAAAEEKKPEAAAGGGEQAPPKPKAPKKKKAAAAGGGASKYHNIKLLKIFIRMDFQASQSIKKSRCRPFPQQ